MRIKETAFGVTIKVPYLSDRGTPMEIDITCDIGAQTYNIAATSSLNQAGRKALKSAIDVADAVLLHGYSS